MKIVVLHDTYGCDTGCCGHVIEVDGKREDFVFSHPYGDPFEEFARSLVVEKFGEGHDADLDFENCIISDD